MQPIIQLTHKAQVKLTAWTMAVGSLECSGLGLIEKNGHVFTVVDVDLLGVGSPGYTEFSPERAHTLPLDPRRKLWWHKHPIGGWSGTDERTATREPLGGIPELVQWACAIVLTPAGWIGRVDIHVPKLKTFHCEVTPKNPSQDVIDVAKTLLTPELDEYIKVLKAEYEALHPTSGKYRFANEGAEYDADDFSVYGEDVVATEDGYWCVDCGIPLEFEGQTEDVVGSTNIQTFSCQSCGNFFVLIDPHSATVIDQMMYTKKPEPAWKQSTWWDRIRGR